MAKKKTKSKKQAFNTFKVSEGRAQKAKKNKSNINFKKFKTNTSEEVDKLNATLNHMQRDVRTAKHLSKHLIEKQSNTRSESKASVVSIDETINKLSNL